MENMSLKADISLLDRVNTLNEKVLNHPKIKEFVEEHELNDLQIMKSMTAFHEYLNDISKQGCYLPILKFSEDYDHATVSYQETEKIDELKNQLKSLFLEKNSVIGDDAISKASFNNFNCNTEEERNAYKYAIACSRFYLREQEGNCVLIGPPGTGKSHLSMSILKQVNIAGREVLYVSYAKMVRLIMSSWDIGESKEQYYMNLCKNADLLVMDDVGSEKRNDWNDNLLCDILDSRQKTIITTNLSEEQLKKKYTARTYSRIFRGIEQRTFHFEGITDKRV